MSGRLFAKHGHGHILNDNTNSGGAYEEIDIGLCPHCQAVIKFKKAPAPTNGYGYCRQCNASICGPCATRMLTEGCLPFMKKIEKLLSTEYERSQFRKVAGLEPEQPLFIYQGRT